MFFGGPSGGMPKLYDGWFKKTGQIQKDIVAGAKSALRCVDVFILSRVIQTEHNNVTASMTVRHMSAVSCALQLVDVFLLIYEYYERFFKVLLHYNSSTVAGRFHCPD